MRYVLGGNSQKREASMLALLISIGLVAYVVWKVGQQIDMSSVTGLVSTCFGLSLAAVTGTTALHHLKSPADPSILAPDPQVGIPAPGDTLGGGASPGGPYSGPED